MASESETIQMMKLPTIDFTNLGLESNNSPRWESLKSQVHKALSELGCFEASFDKVPQHLRKAIYDATKEFFYLPSQTKQRNYPCKYLFSGYKGHCGPCCRHIESMGIEDPHIYEKIESFTNTIWPEGNPNYSKTLQSFSEHLLELDHIITMMILQSLGVEKYLDELKNSTYHRFRGLKYKAPETDDAILGLSSHKDTTMVTILQSTQLQGLELQTKDGKWFKVEPSPENFVVFIGETIHAWTNGRLYSPNHRVMLSGYEDRYTVGLFSIMHGGYEIKAPEELVDKEHPRLFKPFDYAEFMKIFTSQESLPNESLVKTCYGV